MEQPDNPLSEDLSADELALVLDYRLCCSRRKEVIRDFAHKLAAEGASPSAEVIPFPHAG